MRKSLQQFVTRHPLDAMWEFLLSWKKFLESTLSEVFPGNLSVIRLKEWLILADFEEKYVDVFPQIIMLIHAGDAYTQAAKAYQNRAHREQQNY